MLDQLEELLVRESVDTTDPETVALLEEISAEVHAIRRRINSYNPPKSFPFARTRSLPWSRRFTCTPTGSGLHA